MMTAQEIIAYIGAAEKKTPAKVYVNEREPIDYGSAQVFGEGRSKTVFGDWRDLGPILEANADKIADLVVENDRRNSAIPLLDLKGINARIEPGAVIREKVEIGDNAVIMMGAVINIGAVIGEGERISTLEAMKALTVNAAYQYFEEESKGTLEAGKLADLMILDRDPLETPPMELKDVQTLATIKEGFLLWQKKDEIL